MQDKTLPKGSDSDYSLPGRFEEGNSAFYSEPIQPKPKYNPLLIATLVFVVFSVGVFSYYFANQNEIDSRLINNTFNADPERKLVEQYGVGKYGSEHAHAAIAVFVDGEWINFGMPQFQLSSRYLHFEAHNPYVIHKHASNVPLEMLFASIGMKVTPDCIQLPDNHFSSIKNGKFCAGEESSLIVYVNGKQYYEDISQYVIDHNDRILVSLGDSKSIPEYLQYLESLRIPNIPKKYPQNFGNDILV